MDPSQRVDRFMELALAGATIEAVRFALELLDTGTSVGSVICDVLAPAQRQVGELWQRDQLSVADEHLASGVTESTLYALSSAAPAPAGPTLVVVACAEGDWHSVAAHMIAELLRAEGIAVVGLGASTPARDVARFVELHRPDALAVSCSVPLFYKGVTTLADAAHAHGIPVLAGGRALRGAPQRANLLGADGYGESVADAMSVLATWSESSPAVGAEPAQARPEAEQLESRAEELAGVAFTDLFVRSRAMAIYSPRQLERTKEDLAYIVRFAAAAQRVDDHAVFTEFLDWLADVLQARGVPKTMLVNGLEALVPLLEECGPFSGRTGAAGLRHLAP